MKIVKSCKEPVAPAEKKVTIGDVKPGMVFKYNNAGPFLRTQSGGVSLVIHEHYTLAQFGRELPNYVELPNAYLVTGEKK